MQAAASGLRLRHEATGQVLAESVEIPRGFFRRGLGLMFRSALPAGQALLIQPCSGIHMSFMRFPIDAVFLDRDSRVQSLHHGLRPWVGIVPYVPGAQSCVELPAGTLGQAQLRRGDRLVLERS